MDVVSSRRMRPGKGSKGAREGPSELRGCQCILRLGTPGMQTDGRPGDGGSLRESAGQVFHFQIQTSRSVSPPSSSSGLLFYTVGLNADKICKLPNDVGEGHSSLGRMAKIFHFVQNRRLLKQL